MKLTYLLTFLVVYATNNFTQEQKPYLINSIRTHKNTLTVIPHNEFKNQYLIGNFKAVYDSTINLETLDEAIVSIPFIMSVISLIWQSGKTYYVKTLDKKLIESLEKIREVYKIFYPDVVWDGMLLADNPVETAAPCVNPNLVGLVFSGGVDSTYTSFAHHDRPQLLITYLGFSEEIMAKKWHNVLLQCCTFAHRYGNRKNHWVKSNFRFFIKYGKLHHRYPSMDSWREFCQESLSMAGLAAPILVTQGCQEFLISSSWDWAFPYAWGSHPFIDNNISFVGVNARNCDYNVPRQDKIRFIADFCHTRCLKTPTYYVCRGSLSTSACTRCEKCLRTINGLLVEQEELTDYGFLTTAQDAYERTKEQFATKTTLPRFTHAVCHIWQDIQKRARERLDHNEISDLALKEYLLWLCTVDFTEHINLQQFTRTFNFHELMDFLPHHQHVRGQLSQACSLSQEDNTIGAQ